MIDEIAEQIDSAEAIYAIDYRGISVPQAAELRTKLREADASFRIVKNTLTMRAAEKSQKPSSDQLKAFVDSGPTALTFIKGDPAVAAKALDGFVKKGELLDFKGGTLGAETLTADDIRRLARLPSRDQLNAQLAGAVASPITGLVRGLGSMVFGLAVALGQVLEQKSSGSSEGTPEKLAAQEETTEEPTTPEEPGAEETSEGQADDQQQDQEQEGGQ